MEEEDGGKLRNSDVKTGNNMEKSNGVGIRT